MPDNNKIILGTNDDTYIAADDAGNIVLQHEGGNRISMNNTSITPASNEQIDLGSSTNKFRDLYLSSDSIYIGDTKLSSDPNTGALTTAVANGQGGFSAAEGVGPANINSTSASSSLSRSGSVNLQPYTNNKLMWSGSMLANGNSPALNVGQEFTALGNGIRLDDQFGGGYFFEDINGQAQWALSFIVLPGNTDVDTSTFGNLHSTMSAANYKWRMQADLQFGTMSCELVDTSGVVQDWTSFRVVAIGQINGSGSVQLVPGGVRMSDLLDQTGQGNASFVGAADLGLNLPNEVTYTQIVNRVELTNSAALRVSIGGQLYELTRSTDGSGTAILTQV